MRALADAVGAEVRILPFAETRRCTVDRIRCPLVGVAVHLTLSESMIEGDTARISVTLVENSGRPRPAIHYETIDFTLQRTPNGWVVTNKRQLGAS
ncbi:MAG: hypothetical protein ABR499_10975 [Gemmatimonadaceae bacterium]